MKSYIVRTPEHDRRMITVPTGAGDLLDTAVGRGTNTTSVVAENGITYIRGFTNLQDTVGMRLTPDGFLEVLTPGLFLLVASFAWDWQTPGSVLRQVGLDVDGSAQALVLNSTVGDFHTDQVTLMLRLSAGSILKTYHNQLGGGSATQLLASILYVAQLAP